MENIGTFFHKISDDPLVYAIVSGWQIVSGFSCCVHHAQGRPFHVVVFPYWHVPAQAADLHNFATMATKLYPQSSITILCPTENDKKLLTNLGLDALHIHQNAFIDDRLFSPEPKLEKKFSAIYVANFESWKRHELVWGVPRIAVVTYNHSGSSSAPVLNGYRDLAFCNLTADLHGTWVGPPRLRKLICRANCGLILSAVEGANFASAEYMYCGIPVVSTPSQGGREEFFDPNFVTIVDPKPIAVEQAVEHWQHTPYDPQEIRCSILQKAHKHRYRLIEWLCRISNRDLFLEANRDYWLPSFCDKLRKWVTLPKHLLVLPDEWGKPNVKDRHKDIQAAVL
jgi:glycosyltransferase involved in cell wall biosynthesis